MSIFQESGNFVSFVYLNDIAVAAGGKQVFTVGRDVEVAGMDAGGLITYLCQGSIFGIHGKDGDAVLFQTVTGVEVFPIRTEVDVCTSTGGYGVGCDSLYLFQAAVVVTEGNDLTGQFGDEIGKLPVRAECQMARAGICLNANGFQRSMRNRVVGVHHKAQDAVGTEVGGEDILSVR